MNHVPLFVAALLGLVGAGVVGYAAALENPIDELYRQQIYTGDGRSVRAAGFGLILAALLVAGAMEVIGAG